MGALKLFTIIENLTKEGEITHVLTGFIIAPMTYVVTMQDEDGYAFGVTFIKSWDWAPGQVRARIKAARADAECINFV